MARNDPTIYMRIPQELKDLLDEASEKNRRSMTAEVVARLQRSFEPRNDADWELRVATHINEVRREVLGQQQELLLTHIERLSKQIADGPKTPVALRDVQEELQNAREELAQIRKKLNSLINDSVGLEQGRREADRELVQLLDRLADGAIQEELRTVHALEERLGIAKDYRSAVKLTPEEKKNVLVPKPEGLAAYKVVLEEALAARDQQIRQWWMQEFGYDPATRKPEDAQIKTPAPPSPKPKK